MLLNSGKVDSKIKSLIEAKWFPTTMLLCCLGYALFKTAYRDIGDIFQTLLFVGTLLAFYTVRSEILKDKIFILLIVSIFIPVLSWINASINAPELASPKPSIGALVNFYLFFFIAYWLKGSIKNCQWFLTAFIIGVFLTFFSHSPDFINDLILGLHGDRVDFNFINANHGAALLGCVIISCFYAVIEKSPRESNGNSFIFYLFTAFIFLSSVTLLIFTHSRQAWLAVFISLFIMVVVTLKIKGLLNFNRIILAIFIMSTLATVMIFKVPFIYERVTEEFDVLPNILSGDMSKISYSSFSARIHFWYESIHWIKENPIFGLGENTRSLVISMSNNIPEVIKPLFSHLHNGYLEVLVNYGLLGFSTFVLLFSLLTRSGTYRKNPTYLPVLTIGFLTYFIIINFFESYLSFKTGMYLFNCMSAVIYTFHLTRTLEK